MTARVVVAVLILLLVGRIWYRPQLAAVKLWFDGVVNAIIIAIVVVYLVQGVLWVLR
ncbi:MAG TPA: hypothetical protein VN764_03705 [Polyangiaceae bacterium]|nr:hypothetical protein [Polyangiaceae bacterium]